MTGAERVERFYFHNRRDVAIELTMEPWGAPLMIDPRSSVEIVVHGPEEGALEVDLCDQDKLVVYGWSGCRVIVLKEGQEIYSTLDGPPVPGAPPGKSVRDLVKAMFNG